MSRPLATAANRQARMPASEQPYYNLGRLHLVFAASSLALVVVTVWMIAVDHRRPWKRYQAIYRDRVEPFAAEAAWMQGAVERAADALRGGSAGAQPPDGTGRGSVALTDRMEAGQPFASGRPSVGQRLLRLPGLEALARPLAIQQVWLPDVPLNYPFGQVARFDRCQTCHCGIDRSLPGKPAQQAWEPVRVLDLELPAPESAAGKGPTGARTLPSREAESYPYGIVLAARGVLDDDGPTVAAIWPRSPAAFGGLQPGDAILRIEQMPVTGREQALALLVALAGQGKSARLEVRRGLPQPFASHPRLDLFVGEKSPHPASQFGCTVCHDGQGSATEFRFAAHTPNDPAQRRRWQAQHRWFWSEDWDLPMRPARFAESNCLKCHFDVVDLEPWGRFRDPPAPKLVEGYHLVRQLGCFGCHEIAGFDEGHRPVGPDLRLEPLYHEAAAALLAEGYLDPQAAELAREVILRPEERRVRRELLARLKGEGEPLAALPEKPGSDPKGAALEASRQARRGALMAILESEAPRPGTMRKVGPSLRHVGQKLDGAFIQAFVANPAGVRAASRMPRLFGFEEHLEGTSREQTRRFELVELRGVAEFLLAASQPRQALAELPGASGTAAASPRLPPSAGRGDKGAASPPLLARVGSSGPAGPGPPSRAPAALEKASAERGKRLFQRQGCLACHRHADFPESQATQGPDLTGLGAKLRGDGGRAWLAAWLRDPTAYSPRTLMPNPLLESPSGDSTLGAEPTDPAADIAAYLLQSPGLPPQPLPDPSDEDLDALVRQHLAKSFEPAVVEQYIRHGIPEGSARLALGDAVELVGPATRAKKLRYVGRRTIRKRGCFGCHDIPGFEDAQPIGPPLAGWGRKPTSLLDFGQVHRFLGLEGRAGGGLGQRGSKGDGQPGAAGSAGSASAGHQADQDFYLEALQDNRREGFLWQKLRQPRSFDFRLAETKPFDQQLLMGQFALRDAQREAIITFVLGLVAEPPLPTRLPQPDARRRAIIAGRKVLHQYACATCHTLELERWTIEYDPATFPDPPAGPEYPFLKPQVAASALADSLKTDLRGRARSELVGMPQCDAQGRPEETEDDEGNPAYAFLLWEPAAIAGKAWPPGAGGVLVPQKQLVQRRPPWGGDFARLLYPVVLNEARLAGSSASVLEAWGWVPPPLVHEGEAVQPAWLYDYLLAPYVIRPAVALRMPRYNLSAEETARLVDYFAARAGAAFPYASEWRSRQAQQEQPDPARWARHHQAMRLVTDRTTYCAKCHLVGDWGPGGQTVTVLAPNLQRVGRRLRPEYVRRWLANPRSVLPYTAMPVNFPLDKQMGQELLPGTSPQQLDAVLDLLLDYDGYLRSRVSIRAMVEGMSKSTANAGPHPPQK